MRKRFWLSYDLGIDGDYDGLFTWLDGLAAVDCGEGTCSFQLDVNEADPAADLLRQAGEHMKLRRKDRIYVIWRRESGAVTGRFIAGRRRRAPWSGYAVDTSEESEDATD